ncbi:LysR family transcriptional regulator [Rhodobacter sp. NTK016B]|uniref:LysR family transcriptional regulator n=1 Tax=Rhodobacter sp. NTK016B TaxID=2759676 RepID=UPI001A909E15|nr:LysR family transcriptional regulator [Rhodobacter sp. NTK016B]MBN8293442.1 LysR family transcriptional regulator [Rhodobacter sp. NTK016B]
MDRIDCLLAFSHVLDSGSFSAAAIRLGTTQPTISKRIAKLEADFGTRLFLRSTRRLHPTPEAWRIHEKVRVLLETYDDARAMARNRTPEATGTLTISVPSSAGRNVLMPFFAEYKRLNPQVDLDIRLSDRPVNLLEEGVELALRIGELADSALRARTVCRLPRFAVASPEYLRTRPAPETPGDLRDHVCISYAGFGETSQWIFEGESGRHAIRIDAEIRLDDADAMLEMARASMGVAILPGWLATGPIRSGALEQLLTEHTVPSMPVNIIYPQDTGPSHRARRFIDHLLENRARLSEVMSDGLRR